jgi:hypothetical protein
MTLAQILIVTLIGVVVGVAADLALGHTNEVVRFLVVAPLATFIAVLLAWPIARILGVGHLMFLSGPCPNCGRRPRAWGVLEKDANHLRLRCSNCGQTVELWYSRTIPEASAEAPPRYRLHSPKFLGVWKKVNANVA